MPASSLELVFLLETGDRNNWFYDKRSMAYARIICCQQKCVKKCTLHQPLQTQPVRKREIDSDRQMLRPVHAPSRGGSAFPWRGEALIYTFRVKRREVNKSELTCFTFGPRYSKANLPSKKKRRQTHESSLGSMEGPEKNSSEASKIESCGGDCGFKLVSTCSFRLGPGSTQRIAFWASSQCAPCTS